MNQHAMLFKFSVQVSIAFLDVSGKFYGKLKKKWIGNKALVALQNKLQININVFI